MNFLKKVWGWIKKTPTAILGALFLVGACAYYFYRKNVINKERLEIRRRQIDVEANYAIEKEFQKNRSAHERHRIEKTYRAKRTYLKNKQDELDAAAKEGPKAIADKWNEHYAKRNDS